MTRFFRNGELFFSNQKWPQGCLKNVLEILKTYVRSLWINKLVWKFQVWLEYLEVFSKICWKHEAHLFCEFCNFSQINSQVNYYHIISQEIKIPEFCFIAHSYWVLYWDPFEVWRRYNKYSLQFLFISTSFSSITNFLEFYAASPRKRKEKKRKRNNKENFAAPEKSKNP